MEPKSRLEQAVLRESLAQAKGFIQTMQLYCSAISEITTKLEILDSEFRVYFGHNPHPPHRQPPEKARQHR